MLTLESEVRAVTVYRSGAVITREVELRQPEEGWPRQVRLVGLPLALADQSLRVRLSFPEGGSGLLATDLGLELDWQEPPPPASVDLEAIKPLLGEQRRLRSLVESLNQDLSRIESLAPASPPNQPNQAPVGYALKPRRALVQMRQRLLEQGVARRAQLTEQLEQIQAQIQVLSTHPPAPKPAPLYKAVLVTLRQSGLEHCPVVRFHLSYEQSGARWSPSYTLRFDRDFTLAELSMQAHLCQSTGEDWKGVRLEVSTAEISAWKELPELASRRIGRQQSAPTKPGWRPAPPNTDTLFGDFDRRPRRRMSDLDFLVDSRHSPSFPEPPVEALAADEFALPFESQEGISAFLGAASPPPQSAPVPGAMMLRSQAAPAAETTFRSGLIKRGAPAQAKMEMARESRSAPPPPPKVSAPKRPDSTLVGGGGFRPRGGGWQPVEPPPTSSQPTSEQLAFELLYMPGGDEPGRGHLQTRTPLQACLSLFAERFPKATINPHRLIESALQEARRALSVQAPAQQVFPRSLDGFDYLYVGEGPVDLPSDAQFHSVALLSRQLAAHLLWLVVPKITCDVFRQASLESMPDLAVPTGPVDVYVGTDFLSTTRLPDVAPGGNFQLGLGVDQSVRVVRNTSFKESTSGMMSSTTQLRHEVTVEASNQLAREVRLEVQETLPQADPSELKVKLESCEPAWDPVTDKPGVYRWILRIPAGESKKAQMVYSIEMSAKLELVGGNRREE
ncbi:DUF4139 domain-containing protein [bacterium]|nr:DUF4139 domain-containing protein [bacterium]